VAENCTNRSSPIDSYNRNKSVYRADKNSRTTIVYKYLNEIEYSGNHYSWRECWEEVFKIKIG